MTTFAISNSAVAKSLNEYCISKVGQTKETTKHPKNLLDNKTVQLTVSRNGVEFTITASDNLLLLKRKQEKKPISQLEVPWESVSVKNLILGQDNWLLIDGQKIDYTTLIDFNRTTPNFGTLTELPKLFARPCTRLNHFIGNCVHSSYFDYSRALNRTFVSGYLSPPNSHFIFLEIIGGEVKPLDESLNKPGTSFVDDIPQWKGALFISSSGDALFYDGNDVANLFVDFPKSKGSNKIRGLYIEKTLGGRTFLVRNSYDPDDAPYFMEIKAKFSLTPIPVPEGLEKTWLNLFTMSRDPRLWGVTRNSILSEINERLQTVVSVPSSSFIIGPSFVEQLADGTISFIVKNKITKSSTKYFLKHASSTAQCEVMLDPDNPVLLTGD